LIFVLFFSYPSCPWNTYPQRFLRSCQRIFFLFVCFFFFLFFPRTSLSIFFFFILCLIVCSAPPSSTLNRAKLSPLFPTVLFPRPCCFHFAFFYDRTLSLASLAFVVVEQAEELTATMACWPNFPAAYPLCPFYS